MTVCVTSERSEIVGALFVCESKVRVTGALQNVSAIVGGNKLFVLGRETRMARKVIQTVEFIDDLDQKPASEDEISTIDIGWQNKTYRLDLRESNLTKLEKLLTPYLEAAAVVTGGRGRSKGTGTAASTRKPSGSGHSKETLAQIREWAGKNGYEVSPRGRIAAPILEAWESAHQNN